MPIRVLALAVAAYLLARLIQRRRQGKISLRRGLLGAAVLLAVGVFMVFPELADRIAAAVGVETATGIDFLVYVAVGLAFFLLFRLFVRLDRVEHELTLLVRHLALRDSDES